MQRFQQDSLKSKIRLISLENKAVELEIKNNSLEQYGRRNNLEIEGRPSSISDELEKTAVGILNSINADIDSSDMEDWHSMGKSKKTEMEN